MVEPTRADTVITQPTMMADNPATSMAEEMRKTGGLSAREKTERLEEIV